ncbi:hypothetical protein CDD82_3276 [Ophiocordyceps australis]|uniref:Macro domain-containing protein n=1 Tax=Ophiocordyceps australis TaxID=1399860 RepID=A0A2C5Z7Z6_9HYPO|nr:hypothetical protein CDD82_3276 [Ophiocordyceps australis]
MAAMNSQTNGERKPQTEIPTLAHIYSSAAMLQALGADDDASHDNYYSPPSASVNLRVAVLHGDITKLSLDAIVNAANQTLLGGGGVDGAIHNAAGPELREECKTLGGCHTGQAKMTLGYDLPATYVIHTVGPVYNINHTTRCRQFLRSCYRSCLELATRNRLRTIAFCGISTGVYGYPYREAAHIACAAVREYLESDNGVLELVVFVTHSEQDIAAYDEMIPLHFPPVN